MKRNVKRNVKRNMKRMVLIIRGCPLYTYFSKVFKMTVDKVDIPFTTAAAPASAIIQRFSNSHKLKSLQNQGQSFAPAAYFPLANGQVSPRFFFHQNGAFWVFRAMKGVFVVKLL